MMPTGSTYHKIHQKTRFHYNNALTILQNRSNVKLTPNIIGLNNKYHSPSFTNPIQVIISPQLNLIYGKSFDSPFNSLMKTKSVLVIISTYLQRSKSYSLWESFAFYIVYVFFTNLQLTRVTLCQLEVEICIRLCDVKIYFLQMKNFKHHLYFSCWIVHSLRKGIVDKSIGAEQQVNIDG